MKSRDHHKPENTPYSYIDDISDTSNCVKYSNSQSVLLIHLSFALRFFYIKKIDDKLTECLLFPDIDETIKNTMRSNNYDGIFKVFKKEGIDIEYTNDILI